jgi:lipoprotein-releasing system permease protein
VQSRLPKGNGSHNRYMRFELYVALRYLSARRKQAFISLISLISTLGVGVGVAALIIAISLMTGLQGELRDRILGSAAHVYVSKLTPQGIEDVDGEMKQLKSVPRVTGAAPVLLGKALIQTARNDQFITIEGINPALEASVNDLAKSMKQGNLAALKSAPDSEQPDGIVLGQDLARTLGTFIGDSVTVLTPESTLTPFGAVPRRRTLKVVGIYSLGLFEFDSAYGFVSLDVAKRLTGKIVPDYIELRVDDIYKAPEIAADINQRFGKTYLAQDWSTLNAPLFSALWLEKVAIGITISLIMIVAGLNIVASLVLLVMEKSRDIAILKTMGASARSIMMIFMLQGVLIGAAGTTVGAILGRTIAFVLDRYKLIQISTEVYQITYMPFRIETTDFLLVLAAAMAICFVATIYPSRQASRLDPAEALRYA